MKVSRNNFLRMAGASLVAASIPALTEAKPALLKPRIKLSVSSYSYWHFKKEKYPIEKVIDEAAKVGVEGIDILHRQMESEDNAYIQKLKKHAFVNGIAFTCLSIHQSFVSPDKEFLAKEIEHTKKCIALLQEPRKLLSDGLALSRGRHFFHATSQRVLECRRGFVDLLDFGQRELLERE